MNTVASTLALLCIIFIGTASACDENNCTRFCTSTKCPTFNCGNAKECVQGCLGRACSRMTCDKPATSCEQYCDKCTNGKMFCSSSNCLQSCSGDFCDMECASSVKICKQVCDADSTCKITCHNDTTDCQLACHVGSNCTGLPEEPKTKTLCDERGENCTRACTGGCGKDTVSCGDGKVKECHLSCDDGCKMVCGKTVEKCVQKCIGNKPCTSVCDAASCQTIGKFHTSSSAMVCHLNNFMFVLFACIMIFQLKNL